MAAALKAISCGNHGLEAWQLRRIPSTADGFDEEGAGFHSTPLNIVVMVLLRLEANTFLYRETDE